MTSLLDLRLACNTSDAKLWENVKSACARPLSWIDRVDAHDRIAVLVGGGPSLSDQSSIEEMRWLAERGAVFFALGNSAAWLKTHDLPVHFQVLLDAREGNAEFVREEHADAYLIASQCDPAVFETIEERDVIIWHAYLDGMLDVLEPHRAGRNFTPIVGHHTIGLTALNLVYVMGYRDLHLFGYDSSDRGNDTHAFAQSLKTGFAPVEIMAGGRTFYGQPGMIGQAERFPRVAAQLADSGCEIAVHGDGLLPTITRLMNASPPERWVVQCDLGEVPARWDFFNWLLIVEMDRRKYGAKSLAVRFKAGPNDGFRNDGLPETIDQRREMLDKVVRPLLDMIGARETDEETSFTSSDYRVAGVVERFNDGVDLPVLEPGHIAETLIDRYLNRHEMPIVITLREAPHWPQRNSNVRAWCDFARTCGHPVIFVRDTAKANEPLEGFRTCPDASLNVRIRLALYRRAFINLFVANGPSELATMSTDIPYAMFYPEVDGWGNCGTKEFFEAFVGIPHGGQFPWASEDQRIVWADDSLPNIHAAFSDFLKRRSLAAPVFLTA